MATNEEKARKTMADLEKGGMTPQQVLAFATGAIAFALLALLDEARKPRRRVVQTWFDGGDDSRRAMCDDGTMWRWDHISGWERSIAAPIPQPE